MAQSCSSKCLDVEGGESATQDRADRPSEARGRKLT